MSDYGKLYIVSTPIGNLDDITLRAIETLRAVDIVAAEDTRRTGQLLSKFEIKTRMISYHTYNEHQQTGRIIEMIKEGTSIALVSDAGTPAIADPGFLLVREAVKSGIEPIVIPGVSALTFAVTASALPADRFAFYGFPPVKSGRKRTFFEEIAAEDKTVFIYESPHRIGKTLAEIAEVIGPETQIALIREATKIHEEILRDTANNLAEIYKDIKARGEFVVVIDPKSVDSKE